MDELKRKPIVILGSGRSGTTWVQDVIARQGFRPVFEPLHPNVDSRAQKYHSKYLDETMHCVEMEGFFTSLLAGDISNIWTNYRILPDRILPNRLTLSTFKAANELRRRYLELWNNYKIYKPLLNNAKNGLVIKLIRGNLMEPWLAHNFDLSLLYVVRHPGAIVESKIRLDKNAKKHGLVFGADDWNPKVAIDRYLSDEKLCEALQPYLTKLDIARLTEIEMHTAVWCIENALVLNGSRNKKSHLVFYESMIANSKDEWDKIWGACERPAPTNDQAVFSPSQQASADFKNAGSIDEKLGRWMKRFTDEEKRQMDKMLDNFDISCYRTSNILSM
ncbi:hypothetical protein [uncultured Oceanicoccus sp.]|uniref:hypothetical protein n=1 Tax=uncultured Oceanicoccus sp. TaxID=1706381 RepID=UPI0030D79976